MMDGEGERPELQGGGCPNQFAIGKSEAVPVVLQWFVVHPNLFAMQ
jgi:hypothetical protein